MANEQKDANSPKSEEVTNAPQPNIKQAQVEAVNKAVDRPLYASRKKIHPQRVKGKFRTIKWFMMAFTLGIYYIALYTLQPLWQKLYL